MNPLTTRQQQVLDVIAKYIDKHRRAPSIRDLGELLGIGSPNGVMAHLHALRKKGYITWQCGANRTLQLTRAARGMPLYTLEQLSRKAER